jgi:DmsE family decaheme c-type cytochrome
VNPGKSPEACFACHLDKRGEFSLPNSHAVMNGHMSCSDCHDPHTGNAIKGSGAAMESETETCTKCHTAQKGPFVFKHNAIKEGCTACHSPHGSVNAKMLVARDANLCMRCHLELMDNKPNTIYAGGEDHRSRMQNGTCWSAGCHEAVHGSNSSKALRY